FDSSYYNYESEFIDFNHDLTKVQPIPIASDSLEKAFSSHTIEHLKDDHVLFLFQEIFRALKPGGIFRITCPDTRRFISHLRRDNIGFFPIKASYGESLAKDIARLFMMQISCEAALKPLTSDLLMAVNEIRQDSNVDANLDFICSHSKFNPTAAG